MTKPALSDEQIVVNARTQRIAGIRARGLAAAQANYDPQRHLVGQPSVGAPSGRTYRPPASLPLAQALLEQGDAASIRQAVEIIKAVLDTQELSPQHPHHGNWLWLAGDPEVADLNAVQFVMRALLPILVKHGDLLPAALLKRCREAVRLSLVEEERMAVAPTYTNIHLMSLLALLVGGEWLADETFQALGRERWARWVRATVASGAPHEYNSPNYGGIDLSTLAELVRLLRDPAIRLQARLLYERLWLHVCLHVHHPTGQVAGPHCRCYWGPMLSGRGPLKDLLWRETGWDWLLQPGPYAGSDTPPDSLELALTEHAMPAFVIPWLQNQTRAVPYEVRETADVEAGFDLTTYCTPSYALGTASRTYDIGTECYYIEHQANYLLLHYTRPQNVGGWGMMYSRYVVNDRHWGALGAAPDRSTTANFYDGGHFAGLQLKNAAIGLYALQREHEEVHSLKTVVAFQSGADLEQVWINDQSVDVKTIEVPPIPNLELPVEGAPLCARTPHRDATSTGQPETSIEGASPCACHSDGPGWDATSTRLQDGDWLIVADGSVYVGVRPLKPSRLGHEAPVRLERGPAGELWLCIYNHLGPAKRFWDYASLGGAFWRGNLRAGFIVEVAERHEYTAAPDFLAHLQQAVVVDEVDDNYVRTVTYRNDSDELALQYDLWNTEPGECLLNGTLYCPPNLASPLAVQGDSGDLTLGNARLVTAPQQVWLIAQELDPSQRCWIAVNPEDKPTPLRLETPLGAITADAWGVGRIEWRAPEDGEQVVIVEGLREPAGLHVPEGIQVRCTPHVCVGLHPRGRALHL